MVEMDKSKLEHLRAQEIPLARIVPNPFQARRSFAEAGLNELAESIKEHGIIVPIRVRIDPGDSHQYQLVYGERRCRAAALAGLQTIPGEIVAHSDQEMIEMGVTENLQREDLNPLEEAQHLSRLLALVDDKGKKKYSTRSLPRKLGKPRSYLEDRLRLLRLPEDVLAVLQERPATSLRSLFEIASKLKTVEERAPLVHELREGRLTTEETMAVLQAIRVASQEKEKGPDTEEGGNLLFTRDYNKYDRRMNAALERLQALTQVYQLSRNVRQREQILTHIETTRRKLEEIETSLKN